MAGLAACRNGASSGKSETSDEGGNVLQRLVAFFSRDLGDLDRDIARLKLQVAQSPQPQVNNQTNRLCYRTPPNPADTIKWIQVALPKPYLIDAIAFVAPHIDEPAGHGFPLQFRIEGANNADFSDRRVLAAYEESDFPNPGDYPFFLEMNKEPDRQTVQYVRLAATKLWMRKNPRKGVTVGDKVFALGELMVISGRVNVAAGLPQDRIQVSGGPSPDSMESPPLYGKTNAVDGQSVLGPPIVQTEMTRPGFHSKIHAKQAQEWVQVDLGAVYVIDQVRLFPARDIGDFPDQRGYGFPKDLRVELADNPEFTNPKRLASHRLVEDNNPFENTVTLPCDRISGRYLRLTAPQLAKARDGFALAMAEMEVYSDNENVARDKPVTASSRREKGGWDAAQLVDGLTSQGKIVELIPWLQGLDQRRELEGQLASLQQRREQVSKDQVEKVIRSAGITVGTLLLLGIWLNIRSLLKKRRALEALRNRIARDIHDEVGSGLGTVTLLSQMAQEGDPEEMRSDLREIHRISAGMAQAMRDIVWFNRTDVDSVRDLLMKMREAAETMLKGQDLQFDTVGEELVRPISMERRREIFLLYKEALHNILKHAESKRVHIRAGLDANNFVLYIRDDGKGFDTERETSGAGLGSMKQRAAALKGQIQFETKKGGGTQLSLTAKLK